MSFVINSVLISDEVAPKCIEILIKNGINVVVKISLTKEQLISEIQNHDALIVRSATKVDASVLQAGSRLKVVGRAGTGIDNIDCEAATAAGVLVMNTPGGNTLSAVEHTCAMICAMTRHIAQGTESLRAGRWDRALLMGSELMGKTLAIVGLGRIGKEVALRMQAFGMKTIGYDPIIPASVSAQFNCQWMELADVWPLADYITIHVPLLASTKNLVNTDTLAKCRRGVHIINVARGGIVDEAAVLAGLQSGQVGGVALDVFAEEPPTDLSLIRHPRCVSTPHLGASTIEAQARVAEEIAEQLVELSAGRALIGGINGKVAEQALKSSCAPWVSLGRTLGRTLAAFVSLDVNHFCVQSYGEELRNAADYLTAAVAAGVLSARTGLVYNLINALPAAKAAGLQIACQSSLQNGDCGASLSVSSSGTSLLGCIRCDCTSVLTHINGDALLQPLQLPVTSDNATWTLIYLLSNNLSSVFEVFHTCNATVSAYSATRLGASVYQLAITTDQRSRLAAALAEIATEISLLTC